MPIVPEDLVDRFKLVGYIITVSTNLPEEGLCGEVSWDLEVQAWGRYSLDLAEAELWCAPLEAILRLSSEASLWHGCEHPHARRWSQEHRAL